MLLTHKLATLSKRDFCFYTILVFFIVYTIYLHIRASFSFPIPWNDEAWFLWQARGIQKANTLFSEVLDPDRHLIVKPPGYMIVMGLLFKVFGFSLRLARDFSFVFLVVGFGFLMALAKSLRNPILGALIGGLFLINHQFVVIGNLARMESFVFLMVAASFFLIVKEHVWKGLGLLALSPLVHPNGVYFLVAGSAVIGLQIWLGQKKVFFARSDKIFFLVVLVAWMGLYVVFSDALGIILKRHGGSV